MSLCSSRKPARGPFQWLPAIRAMSNLLAAPMTKSAWDSVPGVVSILVRGFLLGLILSPTTPRAVYAAVLEDVEFASLPGNQVEIDLVFSGAVPTPTDFATENPARIAIDFPGVNSGLDRKQMPIGLGVAQVRSPSRASRQRHLCGDDRQRFPVPYEVTTRRQSRHDRAESGAFGAGTAPSAAAECAGGRGASEPGTNCNAPVPAGFGEEHRFSSRCRR